MPRALEWVNGRKVFSEAPPLSVTALQAQAALIEADLYDAAEAACIAAGGLALLAWNKAGTWERTSPMVAGIAAALGLTDEHVDALFLRAAQITV